MNIPPHFLHIYDKPKLSDNFLKRKQVYNYRHQISATGWFDTASCDVAMTPIESELALEKYVGNPVKVYVDNPAQPIWEGVITTIAYDSGGVVTRRSIDPMMNRAEVVIQYTANAAGSQTNIINAANVLPSQAIYGIKEGSIDAYVQENLSTGTGYGDSIRDTLLNINGWPQSSITQGGNRNVHIEMKGYYHTLEWEMHWNTTNLDRTASTAITLLLADITNTTLWFDNSDVSGIETNAAFNIRERIRIGMTKWQAFLRITEAGSDGTYFIVGIEPTNPITGTRRMYYRAANETLEYTAKAKDGLRVRNASGGLIRPWTFQPDRVLRITDLLTGWNAQGDDPRDIYLRSIQYDAERQNVRWQGSDNTTGEGIFQIKEWLQRHDNKWSTTKWRTVYN